jgi:hypothetical protein
MSAIFTAAPAPLRADPAKRVNYTLGLVLGVDEFQQDQLYHMAGRRWHNRLLHGYGTVWGLQVRTPEPDDADPEIKVDAGVAIDPCGREICVPATMCVQLNAWLARHRAALEGVFTPGGYATLPLAVVLCHRECPDDIVPVPGEPCRSQDDAMQPSRIRDSFELRLMLRDEAPWDSPPGGATGLDVFRLWQPEEEAVRAFGELLARVRTTHDAEMAEGGRDALLEAVRELGAAAEPGDFSPPGTGTFVLLADRAADALREAMRVWVTEVRPRIRAQQQADRQAGCACGCADCDQCVLLAEIDLPVSADWRVAGVAFEPDEENRPVLLHTRLLQEWLALQLSGPATDVGSLVAAEGMEPRTVRVWLHHPRRLSLRPPAVRVSVNGRRPVRPRIRRVAGRRNTFDLRLPPSRTLEFGDTVELRFDLRRIPLFRSSQTLADELRALHGELLDRRRAEVRAYTIYDLPEPAEPGGEADLAFHNKHLHGTGIVCGLRVVCGPDAEPGQRRGVTVRPGYAIDCEGNDLRLRDELRIDLIDRVEAWDRENPERPILGEDGSGEACLVLRRNGSGPTVAVEPLEPQPNFLQRVLEGTLLKDFYDGCVQPLVEFLRERLTDPPGDEALVGRAQRHVSTLSNLLVQLPDPENGRYVYLSEKEDTLLRDLHADLRELLRSETFCALYADARPFPDYPLPGAESGLTTVFARGLQARVRLDPAGGRAYTVDSDEAGTRNRIHVFDLEREEMILDLEFPGGEALRVRDVAFSADGRAMYAVATRGADSVFAVADIDGTSHTFRSQTLVFGGVELVTLATASGTEQLFAVARGRGLYSFLPNTSQAPGQPVYQFNASGHLVIPGNGPAYATAAPDGTSPDRYNRVLRLSLDGRASPPFPNFQLPDGMQGDDDIVVLGAAQEGGRISQRLYVVAGPVASSPGTEKQLVVFDTRPNVSAANRLVARVPIEDTGVRLALIPGFLAIAFAGSYRLALLELEGNRLVNGPNSDDPFRHPVQISPGSLAVDREARRLVVLNVDSNTLNLVPVDTLHPENELDLEALAEYRDNVILAFLDLLAGLLQYLKDCFCDRFLVDCPDCDGTERLYLGCASIRERRVHKVCNHTRRSYVKTFPTVGYWLSVVPVLPLLRELGTMFCCALLPDLFGRFLGGRGDRTRGPTVSHGTPDRTVIRGVQRSAGMLGRIDFSEALREVGTRLGVARELGGDWISSLSLRRPVVAASAMAPVMTPSVRTAQVVGRSVADAEAELERAGVRVESVEAYDAERGGAGLTEFVRSAGHIPTDRPVRLFEEDGVVKYYSVARHAARADTPAREDAPARLPESAVRELTQAREALTATRAEVAALRESLEQSRRSTEEELKSRDKAISSLRGTTTKLNNELRELRELLAEVDQLRRREPPR